MTDILIKQLISKTGIKFISGTDLKQSSSGKTYSQLEEASESKTHQDMRTYGIAYFKTLGFQVFPYAIGVKGTLTLADFLAFRENRVVFVECLTDKNLNVEVIDRKLQLRKYGEVCFIIVGGSGYSDAFVRDSHIIPDFVKRISIQHDILQFYYGHYRNDSTKRITSYSLLPKIAFTLSDNGKIELDLGIRIKRINTDIAVQFKSRSLIDAGETLYLNHLFHRFLVENIWRNKSLNITSYGRNELKYGVKFKNQEGEIVFVIKCDGQTGLIRIRGKKGREIFRLFYEFLVQNELEILCDRKKLNRVTDLLELDSDVRLLQSEASQSIQSNLPECEQIAWIIDHFFGNKPTRVSEFSGYLPRRIRHRLGYFLRQGTVNNTLKRTDDKERLIKNRMFIATDNGLNIVAAKLKTIQYVNIPYQRLSIRHSYYVQFRDEIDGIK